MTDEPEGQPQQQKETPTRRSRGVRGFGTTYLRGRVWWIRYWHHGKEYRESSRSDRELDAERLLKNRWKQIGRGRFVGSSEERLTVAQILDAVEVDYKNNGRRSTTTLTQCRLKPLRAAFPFDRAVDLTEERIERYKHDRLETKSRQGRLVAPATVNRELSVLKRAFRLAVEQKRLSTAPTIKLLQEHNARQGFVNPPEFRVIVSHLPEHLMDFAWFGYLTGWRKGEISRLTWSDVNRDAQRLTLRREHSKNEEPRVLVLVGELAELIERRWAARMVSQRDGSAILCPLLFHRSGFPIGDIRLAWRDACEAAGFASLLFHDLRRSAIRNMEKAGVSQSVAMKISGHRTTTIYRRYRIVDEADIAEALARTQAANRQPAARTVVPLRAPAD